MNVRSAWVYVTELRVIGVMGGRSLRRDLDLVDLNVDPIGDSTGCQCDEERLGCWFSAESDRP